MTVLTELRARRARILDQLDGLVSTESPSSDRAAITACAEVVGQLAADTVGVGPETVDAGDHRHLVWRWGRPKVLLLGHYDTVWPLGTIARWPFAVTGATATGPGIFDMKAGVVGGLHALSLLDDLDGVAILLTSDEELGAPTSRELIESTARGLDAVLVLEPSAGGALKVARKGVSLYEVVVEGRAAHAGLEPEAGVNALDELAHQVLALARLARPHDGTTVTPTVANAGTASNVVPAAARMIVDVRVSTSAEQARVDEEMLRAAPVVPGARITVSGGPNRPPLQEEDAAALFARATALATGLGIAPPAAARVGGGSDGNFTAALGVPTLDGLGAVGDGAHAEGEHVVVDAIAERAALVHALVTDVLVRG
ncbi:MAG TPA: M20 family metallopeptidase [Egicoccus sp.]|nr:M20 family metallopeptidase [Egicoccus sp.]HSK24580.1 M20 family metallopeptidase [Egicoccus sp.]